MSTPNDGGPAFPLAHHCDSTTGTIHTTAKGMSLRNWFAGRALPAVIKRANGTALIVKETFEIADAMVAASKRKP